MSPGIGSGTNRFEEHLRLNTTPERPTPPADATPGTRWAYRASYEPAHIQTVAGIVTVRVGTYGRFTLTDEGWVRDDAPQPNDGAI